MKITDTKRINWIASHLVSFRYGLIAATVTWIDDEGVRQDTDIELPEAISLTSKANDGQIFRFVIDKVAGF